MYGRSCHQPAPPSGPFPKWHVTDFGDPAEEAPQLICHPPHHRSRYKWCGTAPHHRSQTLDRASSYSLWELGCSYNGHRPICILSWAFYILSRRFRDCQAKWPWDISKLKQAYLATSSRHFCILLGHRYYRVGSRESAELLSCLGVSHTSSCDWI